MARHHDDRAGASSPAGSRGRLIVSEELRRTVDVSGPEAAAWLDRLPTVLENMAAAWGLQVESQLQHAGHCSVAFHVRTEDSDPAVIKLSLPDEEARFEGAALARWAGEGAARVLATSDDGFVLLLESCDAGRDLWAVGVDEQIEVIADLLPRLWLAPRGDDPFPELSDTVARWVPRLVDKARAMGVPDHIAEDARRWALELDRDAPRRLLHGDLHPRNILAAEREPWLAIDPKPWIGDPAFDLAQLLLNWVWEPGEAGETGELRRRAGRLAEGLELSPRRILRWAVVKALGWDSGREGVLSLHAAASRE